MSNVKFEFAGHNVTMQTTVEFSGNSTANITLSKETSLSFLTPNNFFTKS